MKYHPRGAHSPTVNGFHSLQNFLFPKTLSQILQSKSKLATSVKCYICHWISKKQLGLPFFTCLLRVNILNVPCLYFLDVLFFYNCAFKAWLITYVIKTLWLYLCVYSHNASSTGSDNDIFGKID